MTESIEKQVSDILDTFSFKVQEATEEAAKRAAADTRDKLKRTSPRRTGAYAKSWRSTKNGKSYGTKIDGYVVHNKDHYQITHLLENGHVIRNQYGTYGRVAGIPHIKPAEEAGNKEFEELARKLIEEIKV